MLVILSQYSYHSMEKRGFKDSFVWISTILTRFKSVQHEINTVDDVSRFLYIQGKRQSNPFISSLQRESDFSGSMINP